VEQLLSKTASSSPSLQCFNIEKDTTKPHHLFNHPALHDTTQSYLQAFGQLSIMNTVKSTALRGFLNMNPS
jgi:hypothetical protein